MSSALCPNCGALLEADAAARTFENRPSAHGDLAICFACATLLEFGESEYRPASAARLAEIPKELLAPIEKTLNRAVHVMPA